LHELSIAHSIVEIVSRVAREQNSSRVETIYLSVGELSCVSAEALNFAFEVAARDTPAEKARIVIERKPVVAHCPDCDEKRVLTTPERLVCPVCGRPVSTLVGGRELDVDRIELEVSCAAG